MNFPPKKGEKLISELRGKFRMPRPGSFPGAKKLHPQAQLPTSGSSKLEVRLKEASLDPYQVYSSRVATYRNTHDLGMSSRKPKYYKSRMASGRKLGPRGGMPGDSAGPISVPGTRSGGRRPPRSRAVCRRGVRSQSGVPSAKTPCLRMGPGVAIGPRTRRLGQPGAGYPARGRHCSLWSAPRKARFGYD